MDNFKVTYEQYNERLLKYALYLTHNRNNAEELVQETFYRAIRGANSYRGECSVSTWLNRIMKNCFLNEQKSKRYQDTTREDMSDYVTVDVLGIQADKMDLKQGLKLLPSNYRKIVEQYYLYGFSLREIAELENKSESWARVTLFRAREQLRIYLEVK